MKQRLEIRPRLDGDKPARCVLDPNSHLRADPGPPRLITQLGYGGLVHADGAREGGLGELPARQVFSEVSHTPNYACGE